MSMASKIEPSHFSGGTAYIAVDAHLMDSREPYIFKTNDYGATWKRVNGDLPNKHPLSYIKAVAENPDEAGMRCAGAGLGFFYSTDDGGHWAELATGLPHAPVSSIVVQKQFHESSRSRPMAAACTCSTTFIAPARAGDAGDHRRGRAWCAPRSTYRWSQRSRALINYSLKAEPRAATQLQVLSTGAGKISRSPMCARRPTQG